MRYFLRLLSWYLLGRVTLGRPTRDLRPVARALARAFRSAARRPTPAAAAVGRVGPAGSRATYRA